MTVTVETQTAVLTLNGLDLLMDTPDPVNGYRIHALGDNFTWGDPEAIISSVQSQLQDGDLERIDRYGNRQASIHLQIDAPGSTVPGEAIAQGQAAIDMACRFTGWAELRWTSPLAGALTSVFELTSAYVSAAFDDVAELSQGVRYVTITFHARPFVRGTTPINIAAPTTIGTTTTTVDNGSSLTGWSLLTASDVPQTNLVTNPSFEAGTTGWAPGVGASSIAQVTVSLGSQPAGAKALKINATAGVNGARAQTAAMPVTAGAPYFMSGILHPGNIGSSNQLVLSVDWYQDAAGTVPSAFGGAYTNVVNATGSTTINKWFDAPADAVTARVTVTAFAASSGGTINNPAGMFFYTDRVAFTTQAAAKLDAYFDGASTATAALTYAWTGTANRSTSTQTWTAATLALASGVKGTCYGVRTTAIRRTGAISMTTLNYIVIKGTISTDLPLGDCTIQVADNGGTSITPDSYSLNLSTGAYTVIINRPAGFTTVDVSVTVKDSDTVTGNAGFGLTVSSIAITDNPYTTSKVQRRAVHIYGTQRTELSLSVLGLDGAGTTPVGLGEQALIYTCSGSDASLKFVDCRNQAGVAGTTDTTAVSGSYNTPGGTGAPTVFTFDPLVMRAGTYLAVARVRVGAPSADTILTQAYVTPAAGDPVYSPSTGWLSAPFKALATGAVWPAQNVGSWAMIPLGLLRLPPADLTGTGATLSIAVAKNGAAFDLDDVFLMNVDSGEASLVLTATAGGSYSAVTLNAATVATPQPTAWFGTANGAMMADSLRWNGEQHQASPGLLEIDTVTPGCDTSRVSAMYYPRFHTNVASVPSS